MVRGFQASDGPQPPRRWTDLLTCSGDGRINLNTAPVEVLRTLPICDQAVGQIVGYRSFDADSEGQLESHAFAKNDDIEQLQGLAAAERAVLTTLCKFRSEYYRISVSCRRASRGLEARLEILVKAQAGKPPEVLAWNFEG